MSFSIGIDVGGTKILGGVIDSYGHVVHKIRVATPSAGGIELLDAIAELVGNLANLQAVNHVGLSIAGFVSADRQRMLATPNISNLNDVEMAQYLSKSTGKNVVIENDGNAAAWGEYRFGAAQHSKSMLMVTLGTGIGGGIIVNGELLRGAFGIGGEIGHLNVVPQGAPCGCGAFGCFEQYGSGSALLRYVRENGSQEFSSGELTGEMITELARSGNQVAIAGFRYIAEHIGSGLASLCMVLDPDVIVIGGGVADAGDILLEPISQALRNVMPFKDKHPYPTLVRAKLGPEAGLIGAALLARQ